MNSTLKVVAGLSMLALVSSIPAVGKNLVHRGCPKGYAPLGDICLSANTGDIMFRLTTLRRADSKTTASR